jgi:hypothetical protein
VLSNVDFCNTFAGKACIDPTLESPEIIGRRGEQPTMMCLIQHLFRYDSCSSPTKLAATGRSIVTLIGLVVVVLADNARRTLVSRDTTPCITRRRMLACYFF